MADGMSTDNENKCQRICFCRKTLSRNLSHRFSPRRQNLTHEKVVAFEFHTTPMRVSPSIKNCLKWAASKPKGLRHIQTTPVDFAKAADSELVRKVFDDKAFWKEFNKHSHTSFFRNDSVGLFQNPYLTDPRGLKRFCQESLEKAQLLVEYIVTDTSDEGYRNYIRNLDRLSDILCRVIDLAEFVRVAHPNAGFVDAAEECHQDMFQYMNILNTTTELYEKLDHVLKTASICEKLSEEELCVGRLLLTDFERSGIQMDEKTKSNFVELSQQIAVVGQQFVNSGSVASSSVVITADELNLLEPCFRPYVDESSMSLPLYGKLPSEILCSCGVQSVREKVWVALHTSPKEDVVLLETLLKYRGVLAHMLGASSFSEYQLSVKMAKTPDNVMTFLQNMLKRVRAPLAEEVRTLTGENVSPQKAVEMVKPWDREYLTTLYRLKQRSKTTEDISNYFSMGTVIQGLSNLFNSIYGIQLVPVQCKPGETWFSEVRKFHVVSEKEGVVGIIYLDLFHRENKTLNPAHFTVCCSREIYPQELDREDRFRLKLDTVHTTKDVKFQLPVISLVCNFPLFSHHETLLNFGQLETLFHEMGHAMHSMLGRTRLHNVSGTRCATDFVELPSILMEHFARDPRVLGSFARHVSTHEPLPAKLLESHLADQELLENCEIFTQIKMALLDQVLHSNMVFSRDFDAVALYHRLEVQLKVFADTRSNWPAKFGHLFSYGSAYYSYLFDRAIAGKIWDHLFKKDPLSRESGEKYKNLLLRHGGSSDPWWLLANVLDDPRLKKGDTEAMEIIGEAKDL